MTNYQTTDVFNYLSYMEHYLKGDLEVFHKICQDAKSRETTPTPAVTASNQGSMYSEPVNSSSSSTTSQTTMYPGSEPSQYFTLRNNHQDIFRLTIPITLTLFAVVDCVGYLAGSNTNPLRTNENFKEFFKQSDPPLTDNESEFLNQVFRQGLTHIYFPKLGLGISYHSSNPAGKLLFKNGQGNLILNVNQLEVIVIKTFEKIKQNQSLYTRMEKRYQALIKDYQTKYAKTIASYPL